MLTQEESLKLAINEVIEIVSYDSSWPSKFESERERLLALFPDAFLGIEHVGSTSIPGCPAKPIIDILAAVPTLETADSLLPLLCKSGYDTSADFNASLKTSRWAMSHKDGKRTHHIHLVLQDSTDWKNKILFRNLLRGNSLLTDEYVALKLRLAEATGNDRERYTDMKGEFVANVLQQASK